VIPDPKNRLARTLRLAVTFLLLATALPTGCTDDDAPPVGTAPSRIDLAVVDAAGDPVPGLEVGLANRPSADLQIDPQGATAGGRAAVVMGMTLPQSVRVVLTIHDVEGRQVRELVDAALPAGQHQVVWDGRDGPPDTGEHLPSGDYTARLVCYETEGGAEVYSAEQRMAMVAFETRTHSFGTTDAAGRLTITGTTIFPCFYDLPDQMQRDETGEDRGLFNWLEEILVYLRDPATGDEMLYARPIRRGFNSITIVWDPLLAGVDRSGGGLRNGIAAVVPVEIGRQPPIDPVEFALGGPFPNPFN
jgi:hypothetical protein